MGDLEQRQREAEAARKRLEAKAKRQGKRIEELRDERGRTLERAEHAAERERELEKRLEAKHRRSQLWTQRGCIDGATTWKGLVLILSAVEARTSWGGGVNAADRTEAHADDCGNKSSQQDLYDGWIAGLPGFYPANPPGTGSHEGVADPTLARIFGVATGSRLAAWAWGLDLSDGPGFERGASELGFEVVRPYGNEPWHCNLTADPTPALAKLGVIR